MVCFSHVVSNSGPCADSTQGRGTLRFLRGGIPEGGLHGPSSQQGQKVVMQEDQPPPVTSQRECFFSTFPSFRLALLEGESK